MESYFNQIGSSRQLYLYRKSTRVMKQDMNAFIISLVNEWRENHPKMSARQLHYTISNMGIKIPVGINKFEKIVRENGLNVQIKRKGFPKTSDGKGKESYPNLTHGLILNNINQLFVGDITYFGLPERWAYLFTLKDVYSQRILGLVASLSLTHFNAIDCINQVTKIRKKKGLKNCIHHSDNGSQYNACAYKEIIIKLKMRISRAENCQENGSAEQFNNIVKNMYFNHWNIKSFKELKEACEEFLYLNNHQRAIHQLGNISPIQFEKKIKNIPYENRPIKTLHDFTN